MNMLVVTTAVPGGFCEVLKGERIMATWNSRGLRGSALEELINLYK